MNYAKGGCQIDCRTVVEQSTMCQRLRYCYSCHVMSWRMERTMFCLAVLVLDFQILIMQKY